MNRVSPGEELIVHKPREGGMLYPAATYLPCGCFGLPWPIVEKLGDHIATVECEEHGTLEFDKRKWRGWAGEKVKPPWVQDRIPDKRLPRDPPF